MPSDKMDQILRVLNAKLNVINEKYDANAREIEILKTKINNCGREWSSQKKTELLERQIRGIELIIHGIEEMQNESYKELLNTKVNTIHGIGVKTNKDKDSIEARRVCKRKDKSRLIQMEVAILEKRREIIQRNYG